MGSAKRQQRSKRRAYQFVGAELDVDNDKAEQTVLAALKLGVAAGVFIDEMIKLYK